MTTADIPINERSGTAEQTATRPSAPGGRPAPSEVDRFAGFGGRPLPGPRPRTSDVRNPELGIIVLADDDLEVTREFVERVLHTTGAPLHLILIDRDHGAALYSAFSDIDDRRLRILVDNGLEGEAELINSGFDFLSGEEEYVVLLEPHTNLETNWWRPYIRALESDPLAGIIGDAGGTVRWDPTGRIIDPVESTGVSRCDVLVGGLILMRQDTLRRTGYLDSRFSGVLALEDLALRARRAGERVLCVPNDAVRSVITIIRPEYSAGRVGSVPSELAAFLAKRERQRLQPSTPFMLLASAHEAVESTSVLTTYARAFAAADECALVLYGPGLEPSDYELRLALAAKRIGVELQRIPRVITLLPPTISRDEECQIADEVFGVISNERPDGGFVPLPWYRTGDPERIRHAAGRMWAGRPGLRAPAVAGR